MILCLQKYMAEMLVQGQNLSIQYSVFNVGEVDAIDVKVKHPRDKNLKLVSGASVDKHLVYIDSTISTGLTLRKSEGTSKICII